MDFELKPEQQELAQEAHRYLEQKVTPELEDELMVEPEGGGPVSRRVIGELAADGWMGIGWPRE